MKKFFLALLLVFPFATHAQMSASTVLGLVNAERATAGLAILSENNKLDQVAQMKAGDMATKGYFDHTTPDGHDPWYFYALVGYDWSWAGENLGMIQNSESESAIVDAWMNSPEHKSIMLDSRYKETGIGIAVGMYEGAQTVFVVQEFGEPKGVRASVSNIGVVNATPMIAAPTVTAKAVAIPQPHVAETPKQVVSKTMIGSTVTSEVLSSVPALPTQTITVPQPTAPQSWIKRLISYLFSIPKILTERLN